MTHRFLSVTDALVLTAATALVAGLYVGLWAGTGGEATRANVWVAGEHRHTLALDEARTLRVEGALGESVIRVRDGSVRVAASPGRRQLCVKAGWLTAGGESAVCLPNQVVVRVEGAKPRYDTINF